MNTQRRNVMNLGAFVVMLVVNGLGAFGKINNLSQKAVSDMFPTLLTPAGFTFSIWSVIYILIFVCLIVLIKEHHHPYYFKITEEISYVFFISCLLNMAWIVSFSYLQITISTVLIILLLLSLIRMNRKLMAFHSQHDWLFPLSFGLYAGWIMVASLVNVMVSLSTVDYFNFNVTILSMVALVLLLVFVTAMSAKLKNSVIPLPVSWALWGILNNQSITHSQNLIILLWGGLVYLILVSLIQFYNNNFHLLKNRNTDFY